MYIPLDIVSTSLTIKRSIFTGYVAPVRNKDEVDKTLSYIKSQNLSVRHVCYAYLLSDGTYKYSDDGEPQGTAGLPIYKVLTGHDLTNTLIAVSRVFGGVLLGPGGLGRAYADSAHSAIAKAQELGQLGLLTEVQDLIVHSPYAYVDNLIRLIGKKRITNITYDNDAILTTTLPLKDSQKVIDYLQQNSYLGLSFTAQAPYLTLYKL